MSAVVWAEQELAFYGRQGRRPLQTGVRRRGHAGCHWQLACQCVCVHNASGQGRISPPWHPATDTRTPFVADFDGADVNKVAHYMLRWESTPGETGPWSETASATIGA